jgi:hypothetical protein
VYDGAHGINEMHRYGWRRGRQSAVVVHGGTLGDGMRSAIAQIKSTYEEMIDGWQRT